MTALRILVLPFGVPGATSSGRLTVKAGALTWPEDVSRVKLLVEHDRSEPVGVCSHLEQTDMGVIGLFEVPGSSARTKRILADVRSGVRDAASPGVDWTQDTLLRMKRDRTGTVRAEGLLREVSLVAVPGFVDARVLEVVAA